MRRANLRLPSFLAAIFVLGTAVFALPACGDDAGPALTKKAGGGKGGAGGDDAGGAGGAKPARQFEVGGACNGPQMGVEIDGKRYPIDCDVWRGPNAAYRLFEALDKCCTPADRANPLYDSFTPQGKLVYQIIAVLHQQDAEADFVTVDMEGTVRCENAVNAALPKLSMCQGGVDINAVLAECTSFVFGKLPVGETCPDTDSCLSPASCIGAEATSKKKGVCTPPGTAGVACGNTQPQPKNGTPEHPLCAPGFVCTNKVCVAQEPEGAACSFDLSCASGRCAAEKCAPALTAKVALGGACVGPTDCEDKLRCVGGVCEDKLGGGAACVAQGDDCRVFCDNGKCLGLFCGIDRF